MSNGMIGEPYDFDATNATIDGFVRDIDELMERNAELQEQVDSLTAENRALKQEIRVASGNMRCAIHNAEIAKVKAERTRADYERRLKEGPNDFWKQEVKLAKEDANLWRKRFEALDGKVDSVMKLLKGGDRYTLVDEKGECA